MANQATVQLYTTGPAHTFVQKGNTQPAYLGTAKVSPVIEIKPHFKPVFNDIGGDVAVDMSYMGTEALTQIEYTRYSEVVLAQLQASRGSLTSLIFGLNGPLDIGSLVLTEGLNFTFYVVFPKGGKGAYKNLPAGYRFPGTYLVGPDRLSQMGTHNKEIFLMFHHLRLYNGVTGQWNLGDYNVSACNGVPLS